MPIFAIDVQIGPKFIENTDDTNEVFPKSERKNEKLVIL